MTSHSSGSQSLHPSRLVTTKQAQQQAGIIHSQRVLVLFLLFHLPLGVILARIPILATVHALIVLALGIFWAFSGDSVKVSWVGAYLVGAEVLWRMVGASIFWEFGKYALSTMFLILLLKDKSTRFGQLPLLYFLFLVPAIVVIFDLENFRVTRELISSNLSGPFTLMVCVWFFTWIKFSTGDLYKFWWLLMTPILAVIVIIILTIISAENIYFGASSNTLLSGGFGPNQVSNMLGLGAFAAFFLLTNKNTFRWTYLLLVPLLIAFVMFSALTFSRGGFYTTVASILVFSFFMFRDHKSRLQLLFLIPIVVVIFNFLILPRVNAFTEGALLTRFSNASTTGRIEIVQADLIAFKENLLTGTGLGGSKTYHELTFRYSSAHTEFSRTLAEHGIWGLVAQLFLAAMVWQNIRQAKGVSNQALTISLICWSFLFMMQAAMRLAAPAFLFGLSAVALRDEEILVIPVTDDKNKRSNSNK